MGLFTWFFGEPSTDELAMQAAVEKGRAIQDAKAKAQFDAMISAQRNGGGTVAGGIRLTADGQVDLDGFDLTTADAEALERFKAKHNGGFEPTGIIPTVTVDAQTQQQQVAAKANLPTGEYNPLGKVALDMNKRGSVIARVEDIPSSASLEFKDRAELGRNVGEGDASSDEELKRALAKIGAKPREFNPN